MIVEGPLKCVKYLLFFFNLLFWICGITLVILGIVVQVSLYRTFMICDPTTSAAPIILIGVGSVIFFVAFFGCCGAIRENYCMITTFGILLALIIIAEIAATIAAFVHKDKLSDAAKENLIDMMNNYRNGSEQLRTTVDDLQKKWKCCGVNSSADWNSLDPDGITVPDSCCLQVTPDCGKAAMTDESKVYQRGCHGVLVAYGNKNLQWIIVICVLIALLQVLGIVLTCVLMRGLYTEYDSM